MKFYKNIATVLRNDGVVRRVGCSTVSKSADMSENDQPLIPASPAMPPAREKRHYEEIVPREFRSTIPPHLISHLPDDERFIVETVSRLENQFQWMQENVVRNSKATLDLDERVTALESGVVATTTRLVVMEGQADRVNKLWDWKQFFSGKWAILAGAGLLIAGALVKFLLDVIWKWAKP